MILQVLERCNADIKISKEVISVSNKNRLDAFEFDATDCPDLFPPLVVLAACCYGISVIKGVSRLVSKESNRAETLTEVFSKMGIAIIMRNDEMVIYGSEEIKPAIVSSHHDHRIAMACAIAGLKANGKIIIHDAEAVNKSYPDFFEHLRRAGGMVSFS
jgi:3-phosphoshikimate 1-carboxyvinyltransferase